MKILSLDQKYDVSGGFDLTGKKINKLKIIKRDDTKRRRYWICECDCGEIKSIRQDLITSGHTKSCGCLIKEEMRSRKTHDMSKTIEYDTWKHMIQRCTNKTAINYDNYGGRGIFVCEEWKNSFETFYNDMGDKPIGSSIDRIDNDGNYEPSNCRWVTKQQSNWNVGSKVGTSKYKGVHFSKSKNRWISQIWKDYKLTYIGSFKNELDAAMAYNKKAIDFFGEYACLNKIGSEKNV